MLDVPGIGSIARERASSQAVAACENETPRRAAQRCERGARAGTAHRAEPATAATRE